MSNEWTIYVVTCDGSLFPHYTETTRARARAWLRQLNAANPGKFVLPRDSH